jgi:hypothetical protein
MVGLSEAVDSYAVVVSQMTNDLRRSGQIDSADLNNSFDVYG